MLKCNKNEEGNRMAAFSTILTQIHKSNSFTTSFSLWFFKRRIQDN
jgi:hypothetical protein